MTKQAKNEREENSFLVLEGEKDEKAYGIHLVSQLKSFPTHCYLRNIVTTFMRELYLIFWLGSNATLNDSL